MKTDPRFKPAIVTVFENTGEIKISKFDPTYFNIPDSWYKTINYLDPKKENEKDSYIVV